MKKVFTLRRVILLMILIFIYSFAFLFVKIYAEKSILDAEAPALPANAVSDESDEPQGSVENDGGEADAEKQVSEPVEYIVNKLNADKYPMLMAVATSVPDMIVTTVTTTETEATTAPTTVTEAPVTTTKKTEATTVTTTAPPETEPEQPSIEENDESFDSEEADDTESVDDIDSADEDGEENPQLDDLEAEQVEDGMTQEEFEEYLKSLGIIGGITPAGPAPFGPYDVLVSTNSYKNQTVTIYDTVKKRYRTENAFDLVCEITNYEVGDSMSPEAIKAQAVAAYTYIKYYEQKGECAEIGTKGNVPDIVVQCVEAVDGLAVYYDDEYIMTAFSASTGGYSAASKNVWGGDLPYLQSVKNDYDQLDTKNYGKVTTYTVDEVRKKIESKTDIKLSDNYSEWIRILSLNDNIYAGQLSIDGHTTARINGKERTITGHVFRTYVLNIRSTAFTVSYADGVFTITTYGYGHGVGMSQVGANLYATYGGYTFDQILHHYYTGVVIR